MPSPRPVLGAEFPHHVIAARHAGARHIRVQQEGSPLQVHPQFRPAAQGARQTAGPDETPGTDEVIDDLDRQGRA
jgi:hypothetical protein